MPFQLERSDDGSEVYLRVDSDHFVAHWSMDRAEASSLLVRLTGLLLDVPAAQDAMLALEAGTPGEPTVDLRISRTGFDTLVKHGPAGWQEQFEWSEEKYGRGSRIAFTRLTKHDAELLLKVVETARHAGYAVLGGTGYKSVVRVMNDIELAIAREF